MARRRRYFSSSNPACLFLFRASVPLPSKVISSRRPLPPRFLSSPPGLFSFLQHPVLPVLHFPSRLLLLRLDLCPTYLYNTAPDSQLLLFLLAQSFSSHIPPSCIAITDLQVRAAALVTGLFYVLHSICPANVPLPFRSASVSFPHFPSHDLSVFVSGALR